MITPERQREIIDAIKAATYGQSRDEKRRMQELMLAGACMALHPDVPVAWRTLLMVGQAHKLFRR